MDATHLSASARLTEATPVLDAGSPPLLPDDKLLPHFIRAEANLLRLPLFALGTKGLKTLDGIECTGRIARDGQTHQFTLRATRNTATLYPGPLARSAHLAFLSLLTEKGLPLENPVTWTWRDLCRHMKIEYGGWMVRCLKEAIKSTAMLGISSEYALYSKADGALIHAHEDILHLYDRVTFVGSNLPDGTRAETNYLWLSDWYVNNLNALYSAPLDYALWRYLDERSPIASRLYEFVMINFYSGTPVLRINYDTLAQFLPVRPERYRSKAQQQLQAAFSLLKVTEVLATVEWADSREGLAQLHLYRGPQLTAPADRGQAVLPFMDEEFSADFKMKELRNLQSPEILLVKDFYRLWAQDEKVRPTGKELEQARDLIATYGDKKAKALIPLVVRRLGEQWPDAKSFGAALKYLPDVSAEYDRQQKTDDRRRQEELKEKVEREAAAKRAKEKAALKQMWDTLPADEQATIRSAVLASQPPSVSKYPSIIESLCFTELARRRDASVGYTM